MPQNAEILIHDGLLIDPASGREGRFDVYIREGKVAEVKEGLARRPRFRKSLTLTRIDARGCWVTPGIIDLHVHLRDPGPGDDETLQTGTRSAAAGGVTTVLAMPNTKPVVDSPALVRALVQKGKRSGAVNVLVAAAVTRGQEGERLTDFEALAKAGAAAFSDDGRPVMNAALMLEALRRAKRLGMAVLDHAEDLGLTGCGVVHDAVARRLDAPGIPSLSETLMAERDIRLAKASRGHLHLCHVSCAETVEAVRRAKASGLPVTAEAAPHHFALTAADIPANGRAPFYKMKPPLRGRSDAEAVSEGLADGTLDAIATDHAPHTALEKARGILRAPFGVIGLETLVPLSLELVRQGYMTRRKLVQRLTAGPAKILGLEGKGRLDKGDDGDVTVIDPRIAWTPEPPYASKSSNTPFTGRRLRGRARATVVGGRVSYSLGDEVRA